MKIEEKIQQGKNVFDSLKHHGLLPHHYVLDIGCGWLRVGIHIIKYIEKNHYYAFDKEKRQIKKAHKIIETYKLSHKEPIVKLINIPKDIQEVIDPIKFDYMVARSVFTHIDLQTLENLFAAVIPYLKSGGVFYASFFGKSSGIPIVDKPHNFRKNEYSHAIYPFSFFEDLAKRYRLSVNFLPDKDERWQNIMYFTKRKTEK